MTFQGVRKDYRGKVANGIPQLPQGGYGKAADGTWWARLPLEDSRHSHSLEDHTVEEHEDGTITVTPSILLEGVFHGYLLRGVWSW